LHRKKRGDPLTVGQSEIDHHDIQSTVRDSLQSQRQAIDPFDLERTLRTANQMFNQAGLRRIILDQQDANRFRCGCV